ncbi:MAG: diacylglycerol kinase family protein [Planctomycetia bacterium]|nr:diacylglycerol kinase family protein [Planctomycetia bacterium]
MNEGGGSMNGPSGRRPPWERTWSRKFADAARGLRRAIRSQTSFAVHLAAAAAVIAAAAILRVSVVEWCLLAAAVGGVLAAEVFNTAIESLARAVDSRPHPRLRDALDMASAAVLLAAATAAAIGLAVFGHRLGGLLGLW